MWKKNRSTTTRYRTSHFENNIVQRFFSVVKIENWIELFFDILTFLLNLCFGSKLRKFVYSCETQFYYIKVGIRGYIFPRTWFQMRNRHSQLKWTAR